MRGLSVDEPGGVGPFVQVITSDAISIRPATRQHWRLVGAMAAFVLFDVFCIAAPGMLVAAVYQSPAHVLEDFNPALLLGVVCAILYAMTGGYQTKSLVTPRSYITVRLVIMACVWTIALTIAFGLKRSDQFSRLSLFLWLLGSSGLIGLAGLMLPIIYRTTPVSAYLRRQKVIIQTASAADLASDPPATTRAAPVSKQILTSGVDDALSVIGGEAPFGSDIVLSLSAAELYPLLRGINRFRLSGVDVSVDVVMCIPSSSGLGFEVSRFPPIQIIRRPLSDASVAVKWLFDIVVSSFALLALAPVGAIVSALIFLDDGLPIFFRQPRQGFREKVFSAWKFRTMKACDSDIGALRQAEPGDRRITRVGRILRATYIDEIPQLFNVLQGHMSLVGPRPHALQMNVEGIPVGSLVSDYAARQNIRPGMTGLAQVRGFRGPVHDLEHLRARVASDIEYIEQWSLMLDVRILLRTLLIVLGADFRAKKGQKVD
jgi:lipopolysaccharide/colanic/teichoic acid biosynthesis glycosyltransferase